MSFWGFYIGVSFGGVKVERFIERHTRLHRQSPFTGQCFQPQDRTKIGVVTGGRWLR